MSQYRNRRQASSGSPQNSRNNARLQAQRRRRRRKKRQLRILYTLCILILVAIAGLVFWKTRDGSSKNIPENPADLQSENNGSDIQKATPSPTPTPVPVTLSITGDDLYSHYAVLIRRSTGEKIFDLRSEERMFPASMTKMMTALVAYEQLSDLQTKITLNPDMFDKLTEEGASMAGFSAGEEVTALDLLYGVLLPSGAECCIGLAEYIAGDEESFVELMNQKATELGMNHTHFCNPTGLHDENHYTTVSDMAILLEALLEKEELRQIMPTPSHTSAPTNLHPEGLTYPSSMFEDMPADALASGLILGGKTGYTQEAGQCLASFGKADGEEYILVTGKTPGNPETEPYHIIDAYRCYSSITVGDSPTPAAEEDTLSSPTPSPESAAF